MESSRFSINLYARITAQGALFRERIVDFSQSFVTLYKEFARMLVLRKDLTIRNEKGEVMVDSILFKVRSIANNEEAKELLRFKLGMALAHADSQKKRLMIDLTTSDYFTLDFLKSLIADFNKKLENAGIEILQLMTFSPDTPQVLINMVLNSPQTKETSEVNTRKIQTLLLD
ncbi:MAG: hypothetical protein R3F28_12165 [Candidatus Kapaibacterium sp.]